MPRTGALLGLAPLVVVAACRGGDRDPRAGARDEARGILAAHCAACHDSRRAGAPPDALAVFDLEDREWAALLSNDQLESARWRLGEPLPPDGAPNDVTDGERARFHRYLELERTARRAAPACPPPVLLGAVHDAAFHLEHGGDAGADLRRAAAAITGPLDDTTRDLAARLRRAAAADGDSVRVTEEVRAQLSGWRCLTEEEHARLHAALGE